MVKKYRPKWKNSIILDKKLTRHLSIILTNKYILNQINKTIFKNKISLEIINNTSMFIVVKYNNHDDEVLNIFYTDNLMSIRDWIKEYINQDIISYSYSPIEKNMKCLTYELNDGEHNFQLLKKYKRINQGYIYNSSERITDVLYSISILEFNSEKKTTQLQGSNMWKNVNVEINNRMLKRLDKDSILTIFNVIQDKIHTKHNWNKTEFVSVVSDTLKEYKKEMYKSISKRIKQLNKHKNSYKQHVDVITEKDNQVSSCRLESIKRLDHN